MAKRPLGPNTTTGIPSAIDPATDRLDARLDSQSINAQTGTSYTLALSDGDKLVTLDNSSAITLTVPPNSSVAFPVGDCVDIAALGTGAVTVVGGSGVTVNGTPGLKLRARYSGATLRKLGTDTWIIFGDLSA
jgi:hypothetical protein